MSATTAASWPRCRRRPRQVLGAEELDVVADRGYFDSEEILACDQAGITVTLPKPQTSYGRRRRAASASRTSATLPRRTSTFVPPTSMPHLSLHQRGARARPAPLLDQRLPELSDQGAVHHRQGAPPQPGGSTSTCWRRCSAASIENPEAMRQRRETVEHPFGTLKARMGATHFLMKLLKNVRTEMALSVLAYNLTRVMNILGIRPLMAAIRA